MARSRSPFAARVGVLLLAGLLAGLLVWDRVRVEQQIAALERQRTADCVLTGMAALRRAPVTDVWTEECLIVAAAASTDAAGCLPGRVRPDLDGAGGPTVAECAAMLAGELGTRPGD